MLLHNVALAQEVIACMWLVVPHPIFKHSKSTEPEFGLSHSYKFVWVENNVRPTKKEVQQKILVVGNSLVNS
jgi:hypothetical protein